LLLAVGKVSRTINLQELGENSDNDETLKQDWYSFNAHGGGKGDKKNHQREMSVN